MSFLVTIEDLRTKKLLIQQMLIELDRIQEFDRDDMEVERTITQVETLLAKTEMKIRRYDENHK
jgi:hypothetical protein